jgi:uncharacterized protein (TIGR02453 family)
MDFKSLIDFLKALKKNNNKEWFDANKKNYEQLRKDWIDFVANCIKTTGAFDKNILALEAKHCIFRINRDVRFSSDKSPYKTNFGMSLNPGGKKAEFCGYYLHIEPGNSFVAAGSYMPTPESLANIRQEIDYNYNAFLSIINNKIFKQNYDNLSGEKLQRPPKGYDASNEAIEYIKHKSFIAERKLSDAELIDKNIIKTVTTDFKQMKPLVDFLNNALS